MRVDLVGGDVQGIETVADERQIVQPLYRLSVRPDSLGEARAEEVVRHAPVGCREERKCVHKRSAARYAGVTSGQRERLVEHPADIAGDDDRGRAGGRPDGEAVSRPRVEDVAAEDEHRAVDGDVVAGVDLAFDTEVIGVFLVAVLGVEIAKLGVDVELQQERHLRVCRRFPDDHPIPITLGGFWRRRHRDRGLGGTGRRRRVRCGRVLSCAPVRCTGGFRLRGGDSAVRRRGGLSGGRSREGQK